MIKGKTIPELAIAILSIPTRLGRGDGTIRRNDPIINMAFRVFRGWGDKDKQFKALAKMHKVAVKDNPHLDYIIPRIKVS